MTLPKSKLMQGIMGASGLIAAIAVIVGVPFAMISKADSLYLSISDNEIYQAQTMYELEDIRRQADYNFEQQKAADLRLQRIHIKDGCERDAAEARALLEFYDNTILIEGRLNAADQRHYEPLVAQLRRHEDCVAEYTELLQRVE